MLGIPFEDLGSDACSKANKLIIKIPGRPERATLEKEGLNLEMILWGYPNVDV